MSFYVMYMHIRMCVYVCEFNNHIGISPILSIDESDITEDSATLICELSCFSPDPQCVVSHLTTNNMGANVVCAIGQVTGSVMAYSYPTQTITISGSFPQKRKFRSSCWKGRDNNREIERKYIRPRIRSYSYILPLA